MKNLIFIALLIFIFFSGCKNVSQDKNAETNNEKIEFTLVEVWATDTLLTTCESVLFDETRNILYVSNINSGPAVKDGNGFISKLSPQGEILNLKWITGISAPKGMGVFKNLLYVADLDELVIVDIEKGEIIQKIAIEGSSFLNDIDIDSDGVVFISDSDTGKVYKLENGEVSEWLTEGLNRPNGLFIEKDRILLATSAGQELISVDPLSGEMEVLVAEIGHGDGVEFTGVDGYYLVSDWSGEIFIINPDYTKNSLLNTKEQGINTADIGYNLKDKIVYVPTFFGNRVVAYKLEMN
ncbi:MAG: hypothetical protein K9H49_00495 [Bacteroidales bacterium]|nr:hypothetical protein [Bacteroidales bacterium]MCF8389834.1 hypothetical protein [Bacteroidales bacterium]